MSLTRLPTLKLDDPPLSTFYSCVQLIDAASAGETDTGALACIRALAALGEAALAEHLQDVDCGESAYGPIAAERPWLRHRVEALREQASELHAALGELRERAVPLDPGGEPLQARVRELRARTAEFRRTDVELILDARRDTPALD